MAYTKILQARYASNIESESPSDSNTSILAPWLNSDLSVSTSSQMSISRE